MAEVDSPELIARALNGETVGTADGIVICDSCNAGADLAHGRGEEPDPYSATFTGYATERGGRWMLDRVFCLDCDRREVEIGTDGADEAMLELQVEFIGLSAPPCMVIDVDVSDRSPPGASP